MENQLQPAVGQPIKQPFLNGPTDIALIAAFAALIVVCSLLPAVYTSSGGVPFTLQTFAVALAGAVLGAKRGLLAVLLYLGLGIIGLPVFSGGKGGLGVFTGPTLGYLVAFPLSAWLCGFLVERMPRDKVAGGVPLVFLAGVVSSFVFIRPLGILGLMWRLDISFSAAWAIDGPFIFGDILKQLLMAFVATAVLRAFPDLLPKR